MKTTSMSSSVLSNPVALLPESIHPPFGNYAHGMAIPSTMRWVTTSGQLGLSKDGAIPEDVEGQTVICFDNIRQIITAAGADISDIVHLRAFVTAREYFAPYMKLRDEFLQNRKIASTLLIVGGFTLPEFKIEIEAIAACQVMPTGSLN